ncbi:MAG: hypothetical protein AB1414_09400 [bacterium]
MEKSKIQNPKSKINLVFLIILIISPALILAEEYYGPKKKIIVEDFYVNLKNAPPQSAKIFTSKFRLALLNTNRFVVKKAKTEEFTQMIVRGKILKCQEEKLTKWYEKTLPARFRGPKTTRAYIVVAIDLCDPNRDLVIKSLRIKGDAKVSEGKLGEKPTVDVEHSALVMSINKVLTKVVGMIIAEMGKYKWEARITSVNGNKLYIDSGLEADIKAGMIFKIYDDETLMGETKIIEVNKDFSIGLMTKNNGIKPNMSVRMME